MTKTSVLRETAGLAFGAAIYQGQEKNYSELFKKADIALYKTKASRKIHYAMYIDAE